MKRVSAYQIAILLLGTFTGSAAISVAFATPALPIQAFTTDQDSFTLVTNLDMYPHLGFYLKSTPSGDIAPCWTISISSKTLFPFPKLYFLQHRNPLCQAASKTLKIIKLN